MSNKKLRDRKQAPENTVILGVRKDGLVCSVTYEPSVDTFYTAHGTRKIWDCTGWVPHPVFDGVEFDED